MTTGEWGLPNSERWADDANCTQSDPEVFFPDRGQSPRNAKMVCGSCPVREECLAYSMTEPRELYGVWGGLTETERRNLIRNRRRQQFVPHLAAQNREHAAYMKAQQERTRNRP